MELLCAIVIAIPVCYFTLCTHTDLLNCTRTVLKKRSTLEMYLSTSTSTLNFSEIFRVLYKLYLSTDVLKYKVLLPGSDPNPF